MGHPILRGFVQALHVAVLSCQPHLAQRGGVFGAKPRIATNAALGACRDKPGLRALTYQRALELRRGAQNLQCEFSLRGGGVDGVLQRAEESSLGLQTLDHLQ